MKYPNEEQPVKNYWVQYADYSSQMFEINTREDAIRAFNRIDWETELRKKDEKSGKDCPPGIGFHNGDANCNEYSRLLHIFLEDKFEAGFILTYVAEKPSSDQEEKTKGFFKRIFQKKPKLVNYAQEHYPLSKIEYLINLFFTNYEEILEIDEKKIKRLRYAS